MRSVNTGNIVGLALGFVFVAGTGVADASNTKRQWITYASPDCNATPKACKRRIAYSTTNIGVKFNSPACPIGYKVIAGGHRIVDVGTGNRNAIYVWWSWADKVHNFWSVHVRNADPNSPTPAPLVQVEVTATCASVPRSVPVVFPIPVAWKIPGYLRVSQSKSHYFFTAFNRGHRWSAPIDATKQRAQDVCASRGLKFINLASPNYGVVRWTGNEDLTHNGAHQRLIDFQGRPHVLRNGQPLEVSQVICG